MSKKMKLPVSFLLLSLCILSACQKAQGEVPRNSYEAAASYVRSNYKGETMQKPVEAVVAITEIDSAKQPVV